MLLRFPHAVYAVTRSLPLQHRGYQTGTRSRTVFYLAHPAYCGRIPAWKRGVSCTQMTDALAADTELANRYTLAHENYLAERERIRLISGTDRGARN